jgi:septal ring factor EnvC (AmiA/AmiB activator)
MIPFIPLLDPERKQIKSPIKNHNSQITNNKPQSAELNAQIKNLKSKIKIHKSQIPILKTLRSKPILKTTNKKYKICDSRFLICDF